MKAKKVKNTLTEVKNKMVDVSMKNLNKIKGGARATKDLYN